MTCSRISPSSAAIWALQGADQGIDRGPHRAARQGAPLTLGEQHRDELTAARDEGLEVEALALGGSAQEARQVLAGGEHSGELGEHGGVEAVALGEGAHGAREVARLTRVHDRHGLAGGGERAGKGGLVAAARLHEHELRRERREVGREELVALGVVGVDGPRQARPHCGDVELALGDVDPHHHRSLAHGLRIPSLSMRASGARNRSGFAKTNAGTVRDIP